MQTYQGNCHCGNITFEFQAETITQGLRCNCSLCKRKGTVMLPYTLKSEDLKIKVDNDSLATYEFGSNVAKHHFCKNCGIYTFHQTMRKPGEYRVNLACIDEIDPFSLEVDVFDGASL